MVYTIAGDDAPGSWALTAALCTAGGGAVCDPQRGTYLSASTAWKAFSSRHRQQYSERSIVSKLGSEEELLIATRQFQSPEKARLIIDGVPEMMLVDLSEPFFHSTGLSSRIFVEFLLETGLAAKLPVESHDALLSRCSDKMIKKAVRTAFDKTRQER